MTMDTFDSPRPATGLGGVGERHVQRETCITACVDETEEWIRLPLRSVYVDDGISGWSFEIGPYSVTSTEAAALINALAEYGRLSGDFRRIGGQQ